MHRTVRSGFGVLVMFGCASAQAAGVTLDCAWRPASTVAEIGVHGTVSVQVSGVSHTIEIPSPDGPWSGHLAVRFSLPADWVVRDGHVFAASSGASAMFWKEPGSGGGDIYSIDRENGDFYHWHGGAIVAGGRCTGASFPI